MRDSVSTTPTSEDFEQVMEDIGDKDSYEELLEEYDQLEHDSNVLMDEYEKLQDEHEELKDEHGQLQHEHEQLKNDYRDLEEYFNKVMSLRDNGLKDIHTRIHKLVVDASKLV